MTIERDYGLNRVAPVLRQKIIIKQDQELFRYLVFQVHRLRAGFSGAPNKSPFSFSFSKTQKIRPTTQLASQMEKNQNAGK